ncbi:MAG: L-lactate dehydrogenase [Clostridiales bacterium]|nr:L-lactate dehydrogenase [Clostridiales bacterium]
MNKITIIGVGCVGSTIAYTLSSMGVAAEIVLIDINYEKTLGEALDIKQGVPFGYPTNIYAGTYEDARDSNIVIITSGVARKPGQSRLELAQVNVDIIKNVADNIVEYAPNAIYIIVSNPVDVLTYVFCKYTGLPESKVIGSGTLLDTSRLRSRIAEFYSVNPKGVHAYVLGEHGDTAFVPWSTANISNIPVEDYRRTSKDLMPFSKEDVEEYVRKSGAIIISQKGATYYAVSAAVVHLCKCILGGMDSAVTVSTMLHGEYGVDDVCLSLLNLINKHGVIEKVMLPLTDEEIAKLHKSAEKLKEVIRSVEI